MKTKLSEHKKNEKQLKIVILCPFSYPSVCGVWSRVYNDAKYLIKQSHEVHIFSSNIIKGTKNKSPKYELFEGIQIHRFNLIMSWGENTNFWFFTRELLKINPDIIHSHIYRHPATNISAFFAWILKKPFVLTTHAPFVQKELRGKIMNVLIDFHDVILAKIFFSICTKVIAITKWELPYLERLGVNKEKIVYLPNPIQEKFIKDEQKIKQQKEARILFFGRIVPIKNLECLIKAANILKEKDVDFKMNIIGPAEELYLIKLKQLIVDLKLSNEIEFKPAVFEIKKKIQTYKEHNIFVLPSLREAMPTVLLEAGACGLTLISSKTLGGLEIIEDNKTGYLFEINNDDELAEKIIQGIKKPLNAQKETKKYSLNIICSQLENLYKSLSK